MDRGIFDGTLRADRNAHELQDTCRDRPDHAQGHRLQPDHLLILAAERGHSGLEEQGIHRPGRGREGWIFNPLDRFAGFIRDHQFCPVARDGGNQCCLIHWNIGQAERLHGF